MMEQLSEQRGLGFMRFNFASPRHIVMEGVQRLEKAVKALKK